MTVAKPPSFPTSISPSWMKPSRRRHNIASAGMLLLCLVAAYRWYTRPPQPRPRPSKTYEPPIMPEHLIPSVNLVIASLAADNISWTDALVAQRPRLKIIRYISDDPSAPGGHHPDVPRKGMEAAIYHSYFRDFYDDLPDVSILIHAHERSWHGERIFDHSTARLLERLHVQEVVKRGFTNLGANPNPMALHPYEDKSYLPACSADTNRTYVAPEKNDYKQLAQDRAFRENFGIEKPEFFLAAPGCSQIAVSREAIRRVPRRQFQHHLDWMWAYEDGGDPQVVGRTWEYFWQYLFLQVGFDCPRPWRMFCRFYSVCFDGESGYEAYWELLNRKQRALESVHVRGANGVSVQQALDEFRTADEEARYQWTRAVERARGDFGYFRSWAGDPETYYDP